MPAGNKHKITRIRKYYVVRNNNKSAHERKNCVNVVGKTSADAIVSSSRLRTEALKCDYAGPTKLLSKHF